MFFKKGVQKNDQTLGYFCILLFVLQIVIIAKADPSLKIVKNVNGTEVPVSSILHEDAGANLTLICKLFHNETTNNTSKYFDNEISWGWKRPNIQFKNVTDLQILALNISKPLLQFFNHSNSNQATIIFRPLSVSDSDKYFCMSLKYKLFNIVTIDVNRSKSYKTASRYSTRTGTDKPPFVSTKSSCTTDTFACNSRALCIKSEYVCDNVKDCDDGSDENFYLCGRNPCAGKTRCSNGRCILESLCCDNHRNIRCLFNSKSLCCSDAIRDNKPNRISTKTSNNVAIHAFHVPRYEHLRSNNDEWSSYPGNQIKGVPQYAKLNNDYYSNSNRFNGTRQIKRIRVNIPKLNNFSTTITTSKRISKKVLAMILCPLMAVGAAILYIVKKCKGICKNGSTSNQTANPSCGNLYQEVDYTRGTQGTATPK